MNGLSGWAKGMREAGEAMDAMSNTDAAPFDELETLAMSLCREAGGNWDAKAHKRGHWRKKAAAMVLDSRRSEPPPNWAAAFWYFLAGTLGVALAVGAAVIR